MFPHRRRTSSRRACALVDNFNVTLVSNMWALRASVFGGAISLTALLTHSCGSLADIGPRDVPLQPPDWAFKVAWLCLYATTGAAWALSGEAVDLVFGAITLLCCSWLFAYACLRRKVLGAVILAVAVLLVVCTAVAIGGLSGGLLVPLAAWLAFATYLNAYDAASTRK